MSTGDPSLEDVLQDFMASASSDRAASGHAGPEAAVLESLIARYPHYAAELTDFAVEWTLQDRLPAARTEPGAATADDLLVARAMRRLEGRLAAVDGIPSPFAERSPGELRAAAREAGIDLTLLAKLRDRKIEHETVPDRLRQALARALAVPARALAAHLAGPPLVASGAAFKARDKPRIDRKESFEEAVRRSLLDEDAQARWLAER